jgi:hypothetical protein
VGLWRQGAFWIHVYWPTLSCAVKQMESLKHNFDKSVLTRSKLSFNTTILTCIKVWEQPYSFDTLVSPSWITHYTLYLMLLNLYLFPKLKEHLRQHIYMSEDEVKTGVKLCFHHQYAQFYHTGIMELFKHWQKHVDHKGDYVKKYCTDMNDKVQWSYLFQFYSNMHTQFLTKNHLALLLSTPLYNIFLFI